MAPRPRVELQAILEMLAPNVYFQPPPSVNMLYPCIVYERNMVSIRHADNKAYDSLKRYQITVIDRNPDSDIPDKVAALPTSSFDRHFTSDDLNHDVYSIFF